MSPLQQAAIATHEVFTSFIEAGFTRAEALELTKTHIRASAEGNK